MFHTGDLQSGIALAIAQQKLVACFIHDPASSASQTWEDEFLTANTCFGNVCGQIGSLVADKAVLLKIALGSQEAAFLNAFCPVQSAPALVVIRDGKVLERIEGELGREEFADRFARAVGLEQEGQEVGEQDAAESSTSANREVLESDPLIPSERLGQDSTTVMPPTEQPTSSPNRSSPGPSQANTLLAERARRLEAERLRREVDEKAARLARQKARQDEAAVASRETSTTERNEQQKARDAWLYQQKLRKEEAQQEKARILQQIESDKQERRAAAQRRKEGSGNAGGGPEFSEMLAESGSRAVAAGVKSGSCALQIRLFDGSSIKGKFAADADLATAVRMWVKEASPEGGADVPYSFRLILAPAPSRTIEVGEEGMSLVDLGLAPSATLVLVPVQGAVEAYSGGGGYVGSAVGWVASTAYAFGASLLGAIPGLGGSASSASRGGPYMAGTGDPQEESNARGADMADADGGQTGTKVRVKTLADQRAEQAKKRHDGAEFYNGNSSAFQGEGDGK